MSGRPPRHPLVMKTGGIGREEGIAFFVKKKPLTEKDTKKDSGEEDPSSPRLMRLTDYDLCRFEIMNTAAIIAQREGKLLKAMDIVHPTLIGVVNPTILQKRFDKLWRLTWHTAEDIKNRNKAKARREKLEEELEKLEEKLEKLEEELLKLL